MHVVGAVPACHESRGDLRQVGGGVNTGGRLRDAVEVGTDADVFDACDLNDVIEVVDQRVEGCAADLRGEFAVDLVGCGEGNGQAFGLVLGGECVLCALTLGALGRPRPDATARR